MYEAHDYMLTGARGERVDWVPRISSPIQMTHKLNYQSPVPSGLHDLRNVLLPCRLDRLVRGLE